jgi:hypothetical protein
MPAYFRALKREVGAYKGQRASTGYGYGNYHMELFIEKV